jgi:hypothetical protein
MGQGWLQACSMGLTLGGVCDESRAIRHVRGAAADATRHEHVHNRHIGEDSGLLGPSGDASLLNGRSPCVG